MHSFLCRVVESASLDSASGYPVGSVVAAVDTFFAVEESLTLTGKATSDRALPIIRDTLEVLTTHFIFVVYNFSWNWKIAYFLHINAF